MLLRRSSMTALMALGLAPGFISLGYFGTPVAMAGVVHAPTSSVSQSDLPTAAARERKEAQPSIVSSLVSAAANGSLTDSAASKALVGFDNLHSPTRFAAGEAYITRISHGQAKVLRAFVAAPGIDGFAVQIEPGHDMILYTTANGQYLLMGGLFGPTGDNLSLAYAKAYLPKSALSAGGAGPVASGPPPAVLRKDLLGLAQFKVGKPTAPKHLIMVIDPNCIFCDLTYKALAPFVQSGEVRLTVIPEAFLKPSSTGKAEAILMAKNPAAAFEQNEMDFNAAEEEGGVKPAVNPSPAVAAAVAANTQFMPAHDINGTPFLLYTATSGAVKAEPGMPKNMAAFLAGVSSKGVSSKPATASARAAGHPVVPTAHAVPGAADKVTKG